MRNSIVCKGWGVDNEGFVNVRLNQPKGPRGYILVGARRCAQVIDVIRGKIEESPQQPMRSDATQCADAEPAIYTGQTSQHRSRVRGIRPYLMM